jgi:hypothetical protein
MAKYTPSKNLAIYGTFEDGQKSSVQVVDISEDGQDGQKIGLRARARCICHPTAFEALNVRGISLSHVRIWDMRLAIDFHMTST